MFTTSHILLIEDNPGDARLILELLKETGDMHLSSWQSTLEDGLRALEDAPADAVLLDLGLPDSTGLTAVQQLGAAHPRLPVIILTGNRQEQLAEQALQEGAQDFLNKGELTPRILERAIHHAIERQRLISELMDASEKLEAANHQLKSTQAQMLHGEKMASIGQLAAGVAHEINNPVGFVRSNLGSLHKYLARLKEYIAMQDQGRSTEDIEQAKRTLKIDYILSDAPDLIQESLQGTDRIQAIVQNLKSFSRSEGDKPVSADINACLESTIQIAWNELKYKTDLIRNLGELAPLTCFPNQLNQVFLNLLVNAAQAIVDHGEITVRTWQAHDAIHVSIKDTGCGIAPEHLQRIFEPFFTTKDVGKGTGLGLSISYDIIRKHGGDMRVESSPAGTTFTIHLPLTP